MDAVGICDPVYHIMQCDKSKKTTKKNKTTVIRENARDVNKSLKFPHLILPFLCGRLEAKYTERLTFVQHMLFNALSLIGYASNPELNLG